MFKTLEEIINLFKKHGYDIQLKDNKWLKWMNEYKHYSRYLKICEWLKQNEIPLNDITIEQAYRNDVHCRRFLFEILPAVELLISTKLLYFVEQEPITLKQFHNSDTKYFQVDFKSDYQKKRFSQNKRFINAFIDEQKKFNALDNLSLLDILKEANFNIIKRFLELFYPEHVEFIYQQEISEILDSLSKIIALRNQVAHLKLILPTIQVPVNNINCRISQLIEGLNVFVYQNDYRFILKDKIKKLKNQCVERYKGQWTKQDIEYVDLIFKATIHELTQ